MEEKETCKRAPSERSGIDSYPFPVWVMHIQVRSVFMQFCDSLNTVLLKILLLKIPGFHIRSLLGLSCKFYQTELAGS